MSKDVANLIWQLAKSDKSLQGLALKEMFHKKIEFDEEMIRERLKYLIAEKIKGTIQPLNSSLILSGEKDNRWNYPMIIGGTAKVSKTTDTVAQSKTDYIDKQGYVWKITNDETKFLIESAILPMDLIWEIKDPGFQNNNICVSWKHWRDGRGV